MYFILAEDRSDYETLRVLVRRLANNDRLTVKGKGYEGCGELIRKGAKAVNQFFAAGFSRFIICHDADGPDPAKKRDLVYRSIVGQCHCPDSCCIVVPVQELEAWILADNESIVNVIKSWTPKAISSPELIESPKEYLERLSRNSNGKPLYSHATHNPRVAEHLRIEMVKSKCPSFHVLCDFVS